MTGPDGHHRGANAYSIEKLQEHCGAREITADRAGTEEKSDGGSVRVAFAFAFCGTFPFVSVPPFEVPSSEIRPTNVEFDLLRRRHRFRIQPGAGNHGSVQPPDDAVAEDVAQVTLLVLLSRIRDDRYLREKGRLSSWIYGIARFKAPKALEDRRRRDAPSVDSGTATPRSDIPDERALASYWEEGRGTAPTVGAAQGGFEPSPAAPEANLAVATFAGAAGN